MLGRAFSVLSGLASVLGLGITLTLIYKGLKSDISSEYRDVIVVLSSALSLLLLSVVVMFFYSFRESRKLHDRFYSLPIEVRKLREQTRLWEILSYNSAETLHNIAHYFRNLICEMQNPENRTESELIEICHKFDQFLNTLTVNLHTYFSLLTSDKCAITIKILSHQNGVNKVKTFYRDPSSYRKRSKSDRSKDGTIIIHNVNDNTAFAVISSPTEQATSYLCDDLLEAYKNGRYSNLTQGWEKLYNACAVAGIGKRIAGPTRRILGFLCVDNYAGGLLDARVENYLNGIADVLYILFEQYENLVICAIDKGIDNERVTAYSNWDYS